MRTLTPTTVLLFALSLSVGAAFAQDGDLPSNTPIAFVDSQAAIAEHPSGAEADRLEQQATDEIEDLRSQIQSLAQQAQSGEGLSAEESERYQALLTTLESVQQRYQTDIQEAASPAIEAVNEIIRELANENEIDMVLDIATASEGLVVYARDGLDLTPRVLELVRERHGDGGNGGE